MKKINKKEIGFLGKAMQGDETGYATRCQECQAVIEIRRKGSPDRCPVCKKKLAGMLLQVITEEAT
jgi:rubrerythrin